MRAVLSNAWRRSSVRRRIRSIVNTVKQESLPVQFMVGGALACGYGLYVVATVEVLEALGWN